MPAETNATLLSVRDISKRFGITQALDGVSADFNAGEVHALMGENGAGKSTLGKAIAGLHKPDTGSILLDGQELRLGSIDDAFAAGVRIVHQELAQCPNLSVAENLCLHDMPTRGLGRVDFGAMVERAAALVHRLDPSIDVTAPLGRLSPGRRQICQIAASLEDGADRGGSSPRVIVFDEPTSSLSIAEADRLGEIVRELAEQGLTIIYVSHRMGEIFACCDRVTVLRDHRAEVDLVAERLRTFQVKTASPKSTPGELSGGNQQKLLIARWMGKQTRVLLLDEPTRGIDVGTKAEVYALIHDAASQGLAVLLVSSEMPELLALSDRIMVLAEGVCTGELTGEVMTQTNILTRATREQAHAPA